MRTPSFLPGRSTLQLRSCRLLIQSTLWFRDAPHQVVTPLSLYLDGIGFTKKDSVIGFFLVNMATNKRHLLISLRKACLCRCGCGGWRTLSPIFSWLHYCFLDVSLSRIPAVRQDGKPFRGQEKGIDRWAGAACTPGAIIYLKCDIAEYSTSLGLPSSAARRPCSLCDCGLADLVKLDGWDAVTIPWNAGSPASYDLACNACEFWRRIDITQHLELRGLLEEDRMGFQGQQGIGTHTRLLAIRTSAGGGQD